MIKGVASHTIGESPRRRRKKAPTRRSADDEVAAIASWVQKRVGRVTRGEKRITYGQLRRILEDFGYTLKNPRNNTIDIVKFEQVLEGLVRKHITIKEKRIGNISYPRDSAFVATKILKNVRRMCRLSEEDGVDSDAFYDQAVVIDAFINRYRTILRRLARQ
jgi:hypothetical protein